VTAVPQPQGLVGVLLDRSARYDERHAAAKDLAAFDQPEALAALVEVATDPESDPGLLAGCGESIGAIWARNGSVDPVGLERLRGEARTAAQGLLDARELAAIGEADRSRQTYELGSALLKSRDYAGAIEALEESAALYPHFKTLELLGEAWLEKGEPLKAVVPLAAATTLNAQVRAPALLAEALLALGEDVRAHEMARLALGRDPKNRKARAVIEATKAAYEKWTAL
jgi:tetratricopeptide (TPR) repeat protein